MFNSKNLFLSGAIVAGGFAQALPTYTIIIDAGSSGTRVNLYSAEPAVPAAKLPIITQLEHKAIDIGLSTFAPDPAKAGPFIKEQVLPLVSAKLAELHLEAKEVSVNLLATAGMRKVPQQESAIYASVRQAIQSSGYPVGKIETLSGYAEGIYSWASLNYLSQKFEENTPLSSLEIGGASAQIVFVAKNVATVNANDNYKLVTLANSQQFNVFSRTWLGMGNNDMRESLNHSVAKNACYPSGVRMVKNNIVGAFDQIACDAEYKSLIEHKFTDRTLIETRNEYFGVSGPAHQLGFWNLNDDPQLLEGEIAAGCRDFATLTKDKTPAQEGSMEFENMQTQCADAVYLDQLLKNMNLNAKGKFTAHSTINNSMVNWALGYLVVKNIQ